MLTENQQSQTLSFKERMEVDMTIVLIALALFQVAIVEKIFF